MEDNRGGERRKVIDIVLDELSSLGICDKSNSKYCSRVKNISSHVLSLVDLDLETFRVLNYKINNQFHMIILNEYVKNNFIINQAFRTNLYKRLLKFKRSNKKS
ncbi:MAG: hypothetical protein M0R51_09605 [Clostridia bacterium]|jgi:hypothetical protein|nr:hypothetical protein [Clostridia bacterium]